MPDNLVLAMLREMRGEMAAIRNTLREHGHRLATIEAGVIAIRRDVANDAAAANITSARVDDLAERIDRIERRLELRD